MTGEYLLDMTLSLCELGLPPSVATHLINTVPAEEIERGVRECLESDLTLGCLVDRFAYRSQPIRTHWYASDFNIWRDTTLQSLVSSLFQLVSIEGPAN